MLTGGEGKEGEKHEGDESNLWTCSVWVGMAGKGIPHGEQHAAATTSRGDGAPEALGGGERAGELHCGKRIRFPGSCGVEEDRRWGLRCAAGAAAMADGSAAPAQRREAGRRLALKGSRPKKEGLNWDFFKFLSSP